ncbi:MAG TPA: hypothetical protein VIM07_00750 [Chitinophagaceae bacterium]
MQLILENIEGSGEVYLKILKAICGDTENKSMVDLMCHHAPYTQMLGFKTKTYIDILDRKLDNTDDQKYFICNDIFNFLKKNEIIYDVAICSDGIEHLPKDKGFELIELMLTNSEMQIIFTPLGEYMVTVETDINPDSHKSGWLPEDFKGWSSIVIPNFHPKLNTGAFFAWHCDNIEHDFERVKNELKSII